MRRYIFLHEISVHKRTIAISRIAYYELVLNIYRVPPLCSADYMPYKSNRGDATTALDPAELQDLPGSNGVLSKAFIA